MQHLLWGYTYLAAIITKRCLEQHLSRSRLSQKLFSARVRPYASARQPPEWRRLLPQPAESQQGLRALTSSEHQELTLES